MWFFLRSLAVGAQVDGLPRTATNLNGDPSSPYYVARLIGYNASKAALNMLTMQLAQELRGTPYVINSVSPGYVKTDLTGHNGFMTSEQGARLPVEYAMLGADAVSGRFVEANGETPWQPRAGREPSQHLWRSEDGSIT